MSAPAATKAPDKPIGAGRTYVLAFAMAITLVAFIPAAYAIVKAPPGSTYLGFEYNTDDHMVYAAWMRQAMDGRFFMDNRFTTDPQPGLTVNLYYFVLGLLAKLTGIPIAAAIGRALFSILFVFPLDRLVKRLGLAGYGAKLAIALGVLGGGLGFLFWQNFGVAFSRPPAEIVNVLLNGQLPTDVWQPEGFVFPSMLTNGLFMVSLCLILQVFLSFLDARTSMRAALLGFGSMFVLMNIHSYDALTVGLVMVGFLGTVLVQRQLTGLWIGRGLLVAAGMIAPALWFVHVLKVDAVFQARAATETYSPNFRAVLFGYMPMLVLGFFALFNRALADRSNKLRRLAGTSLATVVILGLAVSASSNVPGYFLTAHIWEVVFFSILVACGLASDSDPTWNLVMCWALVGIVAIYFPGLFQRKLTMGLSVPWAILSTYGVVNLLKKGEQSARRLATVLVLLVFSATSLRWLVRDLELINLNVSNTTRHPVYLNPDIQKVIDYLNAQPGRQVVIAFPGNMTPVRDDHGEEVPDAFTTPVIPDYAPILSGLAGAYSYAGHWSETPDYAHRVGDVTRFFLDTRASGPVGISHPMTPEERIEFLRRTGATYVLIPKGPDLANVPLVGASSIGQTVYSGSTMDLVKVQV